MPSPRDAGMTSQSGANLFADPSLSNATATSRGSTEACSCTPSRAGGARGGERLWRELEIYLEEADDDSVGWANLRSVTRMQMALIART